MIKRLFSIAVTGLALVGLAAGAISAQVAPRQALVTTLSRATQLSASDRVLGPLARSKMLHIVISLKLRNQSRLNAFLANPNHPILTSAQSRARFSPTRVQAQMVATFMKQVGFTHVTIAPNRLLVSGDASSSTVESAFHINMVSVQTRNGRRAFANSSAPRIPSYLHGTVLAILGLQNVHEAHTLDTPAHGGTVYRPRLGTNQATTYAVTGHNPVDFPSIYGAGNVPTAAGVSIGIVTVGSLTQVIKDLNTFTSQNGLARVTTLTVYTGAPSSDTSNVAEWDLDSQDIVGMSGGQVGKLIFYNMPNMNVNSMATAFNAVVSADAVKIINVSIGLCETYDGGHTGYGSPAADDTIFQLADAQGQTFSVASGDHGSDECSATANGTTPSWPASSQYVVAVGGTTVGTSGTGKNTTWVIEVVWNTGFSNKSCKYGGRSYNPCYWATGGSPSTFEPMPSWQQGVGQNTGHTTRGVPDIAFDANPNSGAWIILRGAPALWGGTSLASPLFVGTWARVIAVQGTSVGFAAPLIYKMPSSVFHDVADYGSNGGETAAVGWDYTTGFGSMIVANVVNAFPLASKVSVSTSENIRVNGTLSASDPNGDTLSFSIVGQPSPGSSATLTNPATGAFTYMPNVNYSGSDSFTFKATDTVTGLASNTATVTITVNSVTSAPTVTKISPTTMVANSGGQTLTISGSNFQSGDVVQFKWQVPPNANQWNYSRNTPSINSARQIITVGMDPGPVADTIKVRVCASSSLAACSTSSQSIKVTLAVTPPVASKGSITTTENQAVSGTLSAFDAAGNPLTYAISRLPANGLVSITNAATGTFSYTPANGYSGSDSFTFTAKDTVTGLTSSPATETVTVTPAATPPVAQSGTITTTENQAVSGTLLASDAAGNTLFFAIVIPPPHGLVSITNAATGTFSYTPTNGYSGKDSFTFTAKDTVTGLTSSPAPETIKVTPAVTPPVAHGGSVTTTENQAVSGTLSAFDAAGNTLAYAIVSPPPHGLVSITNAATGTFSYTPANGYSGNDSFTFTATDTVTGLSSNTATVSITINPTPPPGSQVTPVASNLTLTTYAGQALAGTLPVAVTPSSDALSYAIATQPANGTVTLNTTGAFTYTPASGYSGSDSFTFTATDTVTGLTSNTAAVSIAVNAIPLSGQVVPVASNLTLTTYAGQSLNDTLPVAVTPSSDALSYAIATQPANGTVTLNTTGAFTYTPASGYSGNDSFTFTATDTATGLNSNTATVSITISSTPPPGSPVTPVANNLTLTTYAGQALNGTLPAVVTPSSDALSYAIAAQPANGTVTLNTTGAFTYTPASGYSGSSDSFTFTATDTVTGLTSNTATVTIAVNAVPPPGQVPPVASNLTLTTYIGQALNDTLPVAVTPSSDALSYAIATQPANGMVTVNTTGAFTYTPASGYSGSDSFTFTATDTVTGLSSNTATVTIKVTPAATPPVASGGSVATTENQAVSGTLAAFNTVGNTLIFAVSSQPAHGSVSITDAATGAFTYTPANGYSGNDSFTFTAKDTVTGLTSSPATETIAVTPAVTPPVAHGGSVTTTENQAVSGTLSASDSAGNALTFVTMSQPAHGSVSITDAATGAFTYTPASGFSGSDSFTFAVADSAGNVSNIATETITVNAAPPPPPASGGGGGGALGLWSLAALLGLALLIAGRRRRQPQQA